MGRIIHERIKPNGDIHLPKSVLANLGLKVGEEVELRVMGRKVLIEPSRSVVDELSGIIKVDSRIVDEIIENEEFYEF